MGAGQSQVKITKQDRAILDLKLQRDKLKQYQKKVGTLLDREQEIAREALAAGNKTKALTALRQRKHQQSLLQQSDQHLANLQQLVSTLEFTVLETSLVHGLEHGNEVLKELHKELSLERVEKLMDDTREGVQYQNEINQLLQSQLSADEEDSVQAELAKMIQEQAPAAQESSVPLLKLPNAPDAEPVTVSEEEPAREEVPSRQRERTLVAA